MKKNKKTQNKKIDIYLIDGTHHNFHDDIHQEEIEYVQQEMDRTPYNFFVLE